MAFYLLKMLYVQRSIAVMNYLAHAYLSFHHPDILVGNMISDYVKGKQQYTYSVGIQQGIKLHRFIDHYTDHHPATRASAKLMSKAVGRYGNALTDVIYDHFLANDIREFKNDAALNDFAQKTYTLLDQQQAVMPEPFQLMLPVMRELNWLYHYRKPEGIKKSFMGVGRRATHLKSTESAFTLFEMEYTFLKECYFNLWDDLKLATQTELANILNEEQ